MTKMSDSIVTLWIGDPKEKSSVPICCLKQETIRYHGILSALLLHSMRINKRKGFIVKGMRGMHTIESSEQWDSLWTNIRHQTQTGIQLVLVAS